MSPIQRTSGPRRRLTQADVVKAADRLARRGIEHVTMPAVAARLGVTPMALYQHVANKDHLLALLIDSALADIEVPSRSSGSWDARVRTMHLAIVAAMRRYPGLALSVDRDSPDIARLLDGYLQILLDAGFDETTAGFAYTGLYQLAMGSLHQRFDAASPAAIAPAEGSHVVTQRVADALVHTSADDFIEFSLDRYLDGLRALRRRQRKYPATQSHPTAS